MKPTIDIFGIVEIPTFGLMIAIGVLCFVLYIIKMFRHHNVPENKIDNLIIICAIGGGMFAAGASFFDALWHNISTFKETGIFNWEWWGITFSGGLLCAISTYFIVYHIIMKSDREKTFFYFDIVAVGLCIAHAFGRIGCFFGGCCYGKTVEPHTFLSIYYPVMENGVEWAWVLPTQLYESVFLFILAAVLFFFVKKNKTAWYLIGYNVFRFLLEFLRGDDRGSSPFGNLSPSQFLSIVMCIAGIILLLWRTHIESYLKTKNKITVDDEIQNDTYIKRSFKEWIVYFKKEILIFFICIIAITIGILFTIGDGNDGYSAIKKLKKNASKENIIYTIDNNDIIGSINSDGYLEFNLTENFNGKELTYQYTPENGKIYVTWDIYKYGGTSTDYYYKKNALKLLSNKLAKNNITSSRQIYENSETGKLIFTNTDSYNKLAETDLPNHINEINSNLSMNMAKSIPSSSLLTFTIIILIETSITLFIFFYTKPKKDGSK